MVLLKAKKNWGVLDSKLVQSETWKKGYKAFSVLLTKPLGWLSISREGGDSLSRLDHKSNCSWYCHSLSHEKTCEQYLAEYMERRKGGVPDQFHAFTCHAGKHCAVFPANFFNETKGAFIACNLKKTVAAMQPQAAAFQQFLKGEVSLACKNYELENLKDTLHPKALALSTIHSVHRVVSTAFSLDELLPRIARLSMQILKVKNCAIYLVDDQRQYLVSKFSTDKRFEKGTMIRIGLGIEGKVAAGGEILLSRKVLAVPFIEQDVVGLIVLRDKTDGKPFGVNDLEVLKVLSEQTVVAIKNAQLYEETQQLTLGSIKSITELMELDFSGDNVHLPFFAELVKGMGYDLGLSRRDLVDLERAVFLLDAGCVGLPEAILNKRSSLTAEEYEAVKKHPHRGVQVLKSINSLKPLVPIILHHHERYDGMGYPKGLKGEEIPIGARIIAVVDSFTAMISSRPYRETRKMAEAVEEIKRHSGTQFDPKVVESFLKVIQEKKIK